MDTPLTLAMGDYRESLAALHRLSERRDMLVRAKLKDLSLMAQVNAQIQAQRNTVRSRRSALAALLAQEAP